MPLKHIALLLPTLLLPLAAQRIPSVTGPVDAPLSLVLYVDLECPFSASTLPAVEKLLAQHPGQVHLAIRQFPLAQHEHATLAHEAALAAAAQGKYLPMIDLIQANQSRMDRAQYMLYAAHLHLDLKRFTHDLDTHRHAPQIKEDLAEGLAMGVDSTPTLFLNGQRLNGAQDEASLEISFQRALASAPVQEQPAGPIALGKTDIATLAESPISTGPGDAPVTIVEFTDFQCPFCRRASEPMHMLMAQSSANVRWVYRSFPLDFHDHAEPAAEAALAAAAQGQFWPMHDLLFANQATLDRQHFDQFARQLKLDLARFDHDLDTGAYRAQIASDRAMGQRYGVDGTPAFFINGRSISGARTLEELQQAVELALNQPLPTGANPALKVSSGPATLASNSFDSSPAEVSARHLIPSASGSVSKIPVDWYIDIETSASAAIGAAIQQISPATQVALHSYSLPTHPNAALAFRALTAATPTTFWLIYNALAAQPLPVDETAAREVILKAATAAGLPAAAILAAFDDPRLTQDIALDRQTAYRRGIRGVPVVFIGSQRIDGVQPLAAYEKALTQANPDVALAK